MRSRLTDYAITANDPFFSFSVLYMRMADNMFFYVVKIASRQSLICTIYNAYTRTLNFTTEQTPNH